MNWDIYDYIAASLILLITLAAISAIRTWIRSPRKRLLAIVGVLVLIALVWVQLAVGLI